MIPEAGRKFGPYEIQSRLGGGGMGHVFKAWDARLHREVAIKLLNHEYAMPGMRERFLREARAASALNHPNICTIFDIGEQDGDPYLVMELLQGETLKDRIQSRAMQVDEIVAIARETAEALGAAHTKSVVHRDVKPANIFLVEKPNGVIQAKVLDFGLAKIEGGVLGARSRALEITTAGATVGTLAYMSPEQARGEVLDSRSDLFSLGVVMYEMATRHVPFQGATSALVFVQLLNHAPEAVREWNEAIPRELEKIVLKLLAKERTARYQTARELELALLALSEKGSGGWLRKAVSTVPLGRPSDPIVRKSQRAGKAGSSAGFETEQRETPARETPPPPTRELPSRVTPAADQFLRPVARVPRADSRAPYDGPSLTPEALSEFRSRPSRASNTRPTAETGAVANGAGAVSSESSANPSTVRASRPLPPASTSNYYPEEKTEPRTPLPAQTVWFGIGVAILLVVVLVSFLFFNRSRFGGYLIGEDDVVVVGEIENRTGNRSLDDSVAEGLRIVLRQSPWLRLASEQSYLAARRLITASNTDGKAKKGNLIARMTAQRLGAKAYISGVLTGNAAPYVLHVDLRDVASDDVLTAAEANAESLAQIPGAIDTVANELRASAGEAHSSSDKTSLPLSREGTTNLAAVGLLAQAENSVAEHEPVAAIAYLQQAVKMEPKFVQAHLMLVSLFDQLHAETAASDAAKNAASGADGAGDRTRLLAQVAYEIETSGDLVKASTLLRQIGSNYPRDTDALTMLAGVLRTQGHMAEALQAAQQAYTDDPFNDAAYWQAEYALIGLDRFDAAFQLDMQAQRLGLARADESLAMAQLAGRQDLANDLAEKVPVGKMEYRPAWNFGISLDDAGRFAAGATLWRSRAEAASQNESLRSAGTFLLAQGALDRAVAEDCAPALAMASEGVATGEIGREALFNLGMTYALCGESERAKEAEAKLRKQFPQSFAAKNFWLVDIEAALALKAHDAKASIEALQTDRACDLISMTPYLRGVAHVDLHQGDLAIIDFQTILAHRGVTYLVGDEIYPAAQIGVARAFAEAGDAGNSTTAYKKFADGWRHADPASPLLAEARTHAGR